MALTLTSDQIAYIRDNAGDYVQDSDNAYILADATLDAIYLNVSWGNYDLDRCVVFALRRLRARMAQRFATSSSGTGYTEQQQQIFEHYGLLLDEWEERTGLATGQIRTGLLLQHLDYDVNDLTTDAHTYVPW